jgi:hypothetical protein
MQVHVQGIPSLSSDQLLGKWATQSWLNLFMFCNSNCLRSAHEWMLTPSQPVPHPQSRVVPHTCEAGFMGMSDRTFQTIQVWSILLDSRLIPNNPGRWSSLLHSKTSRRVTILDSLLESVLVQSPTRPSCAIPLLPPSSGMVPSLTFLSSPHVSSSQNCFKNSHSLKSLHSPSSSNMVGIFQAGTYALGYNCSQSVMVYNLPSIPTDLLQNNPLSSSPCMLPCPPSNVVSHFQETFPCPMINTHNCCGTTMSAP